MPSWWERLRRRFGDRGEPGQPEPPEEPELEPPDRTRWLPADATAFGVPVLDLISVTGKLMSTTADPLLAQRAVSWRTSIGDELDPSGLVDAAELPVELRYPADPSLTDGLLFCPDQMEDKWVLALRGDEILIARSWTGVVAVVARGHREQNELVVDGLRVHEQSGLDGFGDLVSTIDWLIRTCALGQVLPLPVDDDGAEALESHPLLAFSLFGYAARCAAKSWNPMAPSRRLRTDGKVMQAVRDDDFELIRKLAKAGEPLDSQSPTQGFRPLAIAVVKNNPALVELLLEFGADPNLGDDRGQVPLGFAIVHGGDAAMLDRLVAAGARTDVVNHDQFGLLHAVAETNRAELIPWMLEHQVGLETRTRHGHTPLHIACALGHLEAAEALLDVGADPKADADGKDALAIATEQEQPAIVELLNRRAGRA